MLALVGAAEPLEPLLVREGDRISRLSSGLDRGELADVVPGLTGGDDAPAEDRRGLDPALIGERAKVREGREPSAHPDEGDRHDDGEREVAPRHAPRLAPQREVVEVGGHHLERRGLQQARDRRLREHVGRDARREGHHRAEQQQLLGDAGPEVSWQREHDRAERDELDRPLDPQRTLRDAAQRVDLVRLDGA
ncbi:MAG: hypothetical protein IPG04_27195 [Polyangiaceae bacterium]|nr:hypothetical protein [Polyangiaceae bacterium]